MNKDEIIIRRSEALKIKLKMQELGISSYRIYKDLKIHPKTLSNIISGINGCNFDTINKVKIYLGIITSSEIEESKAFLYKA